MGVEQASPASRPCFEGGHGAGAQSCPSCRWWPGGRGTRPSKHHHPDGCCSLSAILPSLPEVFALAVYVGRVPSGDLTAMPLPQRKGLRFLTKNSRLGRLLQWGWRLGSAPPFAFGSSGPFGFLRMTHGGHLGNSPANSRHSGYTPRALHTVAILPDARLQSQSPNPLVTSVIRSGA